MSHDPDRRKDATLRHLSLRLTRRILSYARVSTLSLVSCKSEPVRDAKIYTGVTTFRDCKYSDHSDNFTRVAEIGMGLDTQYV